MAFDKLIRETRNQLGLDSVEPQSSSVSVNLPWDLNDTSDAFFNPQKLDPSRWDKLYPYRLLVVDITKPDRLKSNATNSSIETKKAEIETPDGGIKYVLTQEITNGSWEFNLPITPQMLRITDQFAITNSATMRGIVEEHNGVKYKMISASGTTGIWAAKPTVAGTPKSPTSLGSIFGGTLNQFNTVLGDLQRVKRAFDGSFPASNTPAKRPEDTEAGQFSTGYYQALLMGQFLERYAQLKKKPENKNLRLVFDIPKQNQSFIVTPVTFNLERNQQKPHETMFSFQLKAWKRIDLQSPPAASQDLPELDANAYQSIIGTIRETRRLIGNNINLLKAVRSDFQRPLDILRQTALAVKDLGGLVFTAIDLPRQLIEDTSNAIKESLETVSTAFERGPGGGNSLSNNATGFTSAGLRANTQESRAGNAINQITAQKSKNEGLSQSAVASGALGLDAAQSLETDPTNEIFENPEEYFDLFDAVNVDDINLSREQREAVDQEVERVRLITVADLKEYRKEIEDLMLDISNNFGAGSEVYSDIYGRPEPRQRTVEMSLEENEVLVALMESIQSYDRLTATVQWDDSRIESPLAYVGGLANEAGIAFEDTQSKLLVPVPFGLTIEEIAAKYLGDPDKWIEISTLNSLTSPYIDEEGFTIDLLSNGDGRQINVNDEEQRLFIGQRIVLFSDTIPQFSRRIIDISRISDTNYLVALDGLPDLENLTTNDNAKLQAYLPGTVNSQNQIYIPVDQESQEDDRIQTPSHLDEDDLTRISKIDFLLQDNGDIAINQFGDFRLANGLTNLIQALKIKIRTQQGSLLRHLDFGLGIKPGISSADIDNGEIIKSLNRTIENDPRFSSIERINVELNGPTLSISMAVNLAGGNGVVPITFDI